MPRHADIIDRYRLEGTYERIRRTLLDAPDDGRLDQALSYWVLPTDRRLPIALLDQSVRELLSMPIEAIMRTPGIGEKKLVGLFDLLRRASKSQTADEPFSMMREDESSSGEKRLFNSAHALKRIAPETKSKKGTLVKRLEVEESHSLLFDPDLVSEEIWRAWCDAIERTGHASQKLGRVAPTLKTLPTVIWNKELSEYSQKSLSEIRKMKTHGSKRVKAILEVFSTLYEAISTSVLNEKIELLVVPRFVPKATHWLVEVNLNPSMLSLATFRKRIVEPLVLQIENDLGKPIGDMIAKKLLFDGEQETILQQAEKLQVTRARVYQLLDDCAQVMHVRWPEGRWLLRPLSNLSETRINKSDPELSDVVQTTYTLFFPQEAVTEL